MTKNREPANAGGGEARNRLGYALQVDARHLRRLIEVVVDALEYFDQRADASCEEGHWAGNEEMHHGQVIEQALQALKADLPESFQGLFAAAPPPERSTICRMPESKEGKGK